MPKRLDKETLYLRHDFSDAERLEMGTNLAQAHNRLAQIDEEEQVIKAQIKDKKATVEQTIGSLARNLSTGWEMQNVICSAKWDDPHVGEVTYYDPDGKAVKTRAMSEQERQLDLPLEEPATEAAVEASVAKSAEAVDDFFGKPDGEEPDGEADERPQAAQPKSGPAELQAFHDTEVAKEEKRGRGRPKKTADF
jgi:hypothetical protein